MVFDFAAAMHRKEEFESARLDDFAFRRRARAVRKLAIAVGLDTDGAAALVATVADDAIPATIAARIGQPVEQVAAEYRACVAAAHAELVAEHGDPTPYRLA